MRGAPNTVGKATYRYRTVAPFLVGVLRDAGFAEPSHQRETEPQLPGFVDVSLGRTGLLDGGVIFVSQDPGSGEGFDRFRNNPPWRKPGTAENGRACAAGSACWVFGSTLTANAILDDVERHLT